MSSSEGTGTGPGERPVTQTGRPPVPRAAPADAAEQRRDDDGVQRRDDDGVQRTEQVPFPLPPLRAGSPAPVAGPPTGQLDLGDYPPKVPGPGRHRPEDDPDGRPRDEPHGDPDGGPGGR